MRLPFCSRRRVGRHLILSLRATKDFLGAARAVQRLRVLILHSGHSLIFNSTHMLASVGSLEYPSCPVLAATCSIDLCAMYPCSSPRPTSTIICLLPRQRWHCSSSASLATLFRYIGHICGSFCTCSACLIMTTEFHYPFAIRIVINLIYICVCSMCVSRL